MSSTDTALPVSLAPMRDAKGTRSVFPSLVGSIPLAFAETELNPTMDFASWASAQSLPSLSPPGLDGDGDGFLDFIEFAMGSNPNDRIDSPRFDATRVKHREQTVLQLTYDESVNARGMRFGLQASTDGVTWENVRGHFRLHQRFQLHPQRRSVRLHSIRDLSELPWRMFRIEASVE